MSAYDLLIGPFAEFEFMRRALVGSLALWLGAGPIGVFLMLRRMSLVGDAMAHAILPGAAVGRPMRRSSRSHPGTRRAGSSSPSRARRSRSSTACMDWLRATSRRRSPARSWLLRRAVSREARSPTHSMRTQR